MIDTHCHLYFPEYESDRKAVVARAAERGVLGMIQVGIDADTNQKAVEMARSHPAQMRATVGWHPHEADFLTPERLEELAAWIHSGEPLICGVGECGLDYFKAKSAPARQKEVFAALCELAGSAGLPLVVHSRDAFEDTLSVLRDARKKHPGLKGVLHCFTYGPDEARRAAGEGFYISFSGILTFKNAGNIREAAAAAPEDRIVIETDAPFLAPGPHRGARNEPSFLPATASALAEIRGISLSSITEITTQNARRLFDWAGVTA